MHIQYSYIYTWRNSPWLFPLPLLVPLCLPFISPSTYLAPSSCDRNRPPPSQVACKLTPFAPPFTQPSQPFQIPRTPTAPRLTTTTSGIFRLLLSGTIYTSEHMLVYALVMFCVELLCIPGRFFHPENCIWPEIAKSVKIVRTWAAWQVAEGGGGGGRVGTQALTKPYQAETYPVKCPQV
jgi:hypothetical protein